MQTGGSESGDISTKSKFTEFATSIESSILHIFEFPSWSINLTVVAVISLLTLTLSLPFPI